MTNWCRTNLNREVGFKEGNGLLPSHGQTGKNAHPSRMRYRIPRDTPTEDRPSVRDNDKTEMTKTASRTDDEWFGKDTLNAE
jgi:hypothetical protein